MKVATLTLLAAAAYTPSTLPDLDIESRDFRQAEGSYEVGTLLAADRFSESAEHSVKLFRARNYDFATLEMATLVQSAARGMKLLYPQVERIQVGDFSQQAGGDIPGHQSHENGLDVDLSYYRTDARELDPKTAREFPDEYVQAGELSPIFDLEKNLRVLELIVSSGMVNRIFVDPVIKVRLCEYSEILGEKERLKETLRRLRPYPRHGDHFHVRLKCPKASTKCIPEKELPLGDGCTEAKADAARMYPTRPRHSGWSSKGYDSGPADSAADREIQESAIHLFELQKTLEEGPGC